MKENKSLGINIGIIIWPIVVLVLGVWFLLILKTFLLDMNKINAATNAANCQLAINKENLAEQPLICKYIFDSAKR